MERFGNIVVEIAKLRDYCLNHRHPRGRHKARVFQSRLGLMSDDAELLRQALIQAAEQRPGDLRTAESDPYGQRYTLDFEMTTSTGTATIRSTWIVKSGESVLRLTSCYVL